MSTVACTESATPANSGSSDPSKADSDEDDETPDEELPDAPKRDAGKTSPDSGTTKPGSTSTSQKDSSTAKPTPNAGADGGADAAVPDSGSPRAEDSGSPSQPEPVDIPAPVSEPLVWGFGIGITDMANATKFYTEVMKMTVEKEGIKRHDSTETRLYASMPNKGARVVLMNFDDMRNTKKISAKLVFQSSTTSAVNSAAAKFPDYESRLNLGIVQFDGPDTYIHEVGGSFSSGGTGTFPVAMGFATSDLAASRKFYMALGMEESRLGSFSVTDATGSGNITEYTVKFTMGTGIVLQQWTPMRNAKDNPIKIVMMVPNAKTIADKVVAAGGSIVREAERIPAYDHRLVVLAKDLDGYLLEIVE